jgi:hypothetical protein
LSETTRPSVIITTGIEGYQFIRSKVNDGSTTVSPAGAATHGYVGTRALQSDLKPRKLTDSSSIDGGRRATYKKSTRRKPRRHTRNYQSHNNKRKQHSSKKSTIKHRKSYRKHNRTIKRHKNRRHH